MAEHPVRLAPYQVLRAMTIALACVVALASCAPPPSVLTPSAPSTPVVLRDADLRARLRVLVDILGDTATEKLVMTTLMGPDAMPEDPSIEDFLTITTPLRDRYQRSLDAAAEALEEMKTLIEMARAGGYADELRLEPSVLDELTALWRLWLEAEDFQNDPEMMCLHLIDDMTVGFGEAPPEWTQCFLDNLSNPIVREGSFDAAERLHEMGPAVGRAWPSG